MTLSLSKLSTHSRGMVAGLLTISILCGLSEAQDTSKVSYSLAFESKNLELTLKPGEENADITFRFKNSSSKRVEIDSLQVACSCLGVNLKGDKKVYDPGENGEIIARFSVGNLMGTMEKHVIVKLARESPGSEPIILTTKITIPELIEITPRTLNWKQGVSPTPQVQKILIHHNEPIHITSVVSTSSQFPVQLKTIRDGWEYEVSVTPEKTNEPGMAIIKITSDSKISRYRQINAFALVKH